MVIVGIKNGNIEVALKEYKRKIQKVKQVEELRERKEFIKKSRLVHGDKYDYSKVEYVNGQKYVIIIYKITVFEETSQTLNY